MRPMLAKTIGPKFDRFPCFLQPKLNGERVLVQGTTFQSRGEKLWKDHFFLTIQAQLRSLCIGPIILDGEFYRHGWKLQRINSAIGVNNNNPNDDTPQIQLHVFDIVDPKQFFSDRWADIYHKINNASLSHIKAVPTHYVFDRGQVEQYFQMYTAQGYEGVMLRPDGLYEFGEHFSERVQHMTEHRSTTLWKYKSWDDDIFQCVGVTQGLGKASIGIGALQFQPRSETLLRWQIPAEVGTGFSDTERIEFMRNPPINRLVKIRYISLSNDLKPQNASFICLIS